MTLSFSNIAQGLGGFLNVIQGISTLQSGASLQASSIIQGAEVSAAGAQLTAAGFRQQAVTVQEATDFNLKIQALNTSRQVQDLTRQFQKTVGAQITQQAGSGISLTSKSFLMLQNEASDFFTRQLRNLKVDAENARRAETFRAESQRVQLENQARAAEYQAAAERVLAANRAAAVKFQAEAQSNQQFGKAIGSLASTLLGG